MPKKGKITMFNNANGLLIAPKYIELDSGTKQNYSWSGEDYKQSVVASDIANAIAKPEDFIPFPFRHLSATIVGGWSWKATEFSEKVLQDAAKLLEYKPALVNHKAETGNMIGVNGKVTFEKAYKAKDGTLIPAGLNAPIWIDGKLHTDLCRKLSAFPVPHIQSVSVSLLFEWEASHTFQGRDGADDEWEFEMRIGTLVDGRMVRRIVTKIIDFYETSLVFLGADPYAKIVDSNGALVNVEKSAIVGKQMFSDDKIGAEHYKKTDGHFYLFDDVTFTNEKNINLRESINIGFSKSGNSTKKEDMKTLKLQGKKEDYSAEEIAEFEKKYVVEFVAVEESEEIKTLRSEHEQFGKDKTTYEAFVKKSGEDLKKATDDLKAANDNLAEYEKIIPQAELAEFAKVVALDQIKPMAEFGKTVFDSKRAECVRLYKVSVKDKVNEAVVKTIEDANFDALQGLMEQYGGTCIEKFGAKCTKCGSNDVNFRSSVNEDDTDDKNTAEYESGSMAERTRN